MFTTDIIARLMRHPESKEILEKLNDRIAEESQTPDATAILKAYQTGNVEDMFAAFTGWGMKEFLAVAGITPDTTNLFASSPSNVLFPYIQSVVTSEPRSPMELRIFMCEDDVFEVRAKGGIPADVTVIQTHIDKYDRDQPENIGRAEKVNDFERATYDDPAWVSLNYDHYDCSNWKLRETLRFKIYRYSAPISERLKDNFGEFCITDPEKLTIARWNDGNPEPLFDLATDIDGLTGENEVAIHNSVFDGNNGEIIDDTGFGFSRYDVVQSINMDHGVCIIGSVVRSRGDYLIFRVNPMALDNYLYRGEEGSNTENSETPASDVPSVNTDPCRFPIFDSQHRKLGVFCITDPEKLTIARWNNGNPEPLFDLVVSKNQLRAEGIDTERNIGKNEVAFNIEDDIIDGVAPVNAFSALRNIGAITVDHRYVRTEKDFHNTCHSIGRINHDVVSEYLYRKD